MMLERLPYCVYSPFAERSSFELRPCREQQLVTRIYQVSDDDFRDAKLTFVGASISLMPFPVHERDSA